MNTPNWQHNSGKPQKRTLKPQALRQAKKRRGACGFNVRFCGLPELCCQLGVVIGLFFIK